ncbi:MAG: hypothetical protein EXS05_20275 [Planctomycetaceae bacterium]|nr:hypothetical protein [Planctomycetaceae bacterium]
MTTAGVGGPITGRGAHLLIADDPIKNDGEAPSSTHRQKQWDWWQSTASTRMRPGGLFVVVQTRWHRRQNPAGSQDHRPALAGSASPGAGRRPRPPGPGACLLRRRELAEIVAQSLKKFDGDSYELTDFVVMPNHIHLLVAFPDEPLMLKQCANWKRYTARRINEASSERGEFWQEDAFDHLVRSPEQFEYYRRYIADNGPKANLPKTDYLLFSKV